MPAVRTVPFFVIGMLLSSAGSVLGLVVTIAAAIASVISLRIWREYFASVVSVYLGSLFVMLYIFVNIQPVLEADGTVQLLQCKVVSSYNYDSYSSSVCDTVINGRKARIEIYSDSSFDTGDMITAHIALKIAERRSPLNTVFSGRVEEVVEIKPPVFSLTKAITDFREHLSKDILTNMNGRCAELANGLLFGNTSGFSTELWHASKVSGILHFTAVSGTHFVVIISTLLEVFKEYKRLRAAASLLIIPIAVIFFGSEPTVVRAGIMLFLCNCAPLFSREAVGINSLCISVALMILSSPCVIADIGFQMSVLGVFGVMVVGASVNRFVRKTFGIPRALFPIVNIIVSSACATICIAPISAAFFGGVSMAGPFATVALTPFFALVLLMALLFAVTGFLPVVAVVNLLTEIMYEIILFFGSDSRVWLVMDFDRTGLLAFATALLLTLCVFSQKNYSYYAAGTVATILLAFLLSCQSGCMRRKIDFVSDGSSGAAVVCIKDKAAIYIRGSGGGIGVQLTDSLLRNGIYRINIVVTENISDAGVEMLGQLSELYPVDEIVTGRYAAQLKQRCPDSKIVEDEVDKISVDGITIAGAKAGDTQCNADIVIYTGYKKSEPQYGAVLLPLYASSRQNYLPESGINIYDMDFEISLEN